MDKTNKKPILCLDFDGVCHSYVSGWKGATVIPDDAVPGLFEFLQEAAIYFDVQVYSTRSETEGGRNAMILWFYEQRKKWRLAGGIDKGIPFSISFPETKPPALVTLDDRAITFNGNWPSIESLKRFTPWFVRPSEQAIANDGAGETAAVCSGYHRGPFIRSQDGSQYCVACKTDIGPEVKDG